MREGQREWEKVKMLLKLTQNSYLEALTEFERVLAKNEMKEWEKDRKREKREKIEIKHWHFTFNLFMCAQITVINKKPASFCVFLTLNGSFFFDKKWHKH